MTYTFLHVFTSRHVVFTLRLHSVSLSGFAAAPFATLSLTVYLSVCSCPADDTVREYSLSANGLHELARIPVGGSPWRLLCDRENQLLLVTDYDDSVRVCRTQSDAAGWQVSRLAVDDAAGAISIGRWSMMDTNRLALVDGKSGDVLQMEYE